MKRREFLKTSGVVAGSAAVGFGVASQQGTEIVAAAELDEPVELLTDEFGVTHVYAESLYGVGYGQGYVQARDRLFQMDLLRMIGYGESATVIGPSQVSSDIEVKRDLYSREELETQWENATDDAREAIRGYTDGVNHQMRRLKARGELPGEFTLLARRPEKWKPLDTLATIAYTIGFFGVSGGAGRGNAETLLELFDNVGDIFDSKEEAWEAYHDINKVQVPDEHYGSLQSHEVEPTDERALGYDEVPDAQWEAIAAAADAEPWGIEESDFDGLSDAFGVALGLLEGTSFGSNAIIVDGEYTETGDAMLGGGPQMSLLKPPIIHEIGLHGSAFDVVGVGVVGAPGIVVGRTPEFAWTVTTSRGDMVDTISVELDPNDRYRYRWDGDWHEFAIEEYTHEPNLWGGIVDGNMSPETVTQEVAYVEQEGTRMPVVAYNEEANIAYVRRTASRMLELDGAFMWAEVGRANNQAEFEESFSEFPFGFNYHYIDDEGIAYYQTGRLPQRGSAGVADPRFPVPQQYHDWEGFNEGIAIESREPERGYVVNWNNAPASGTRNGDSEFEWDGVQRVDALERLTQEYIADTDGNLSIADVEAIIERGAVEQPFAPRVVPHLVTAARETDDSQLHAMADELERWGDNDYPYSHEDDGRYQPGVAIYEDVRTELERLLYEQPLGERAPEIEFNPRAGDALSGSVDPHAGAHGSTTKTTTVLVDTLEGRATFDWFRGEQQETVLDALHTAGDSLEDQFETDDPSEWRREGHESEFFPLGGAAIDTLPSSNRASYQQSIAIGEGEGAERDLARSVLPPSNTGHLNTWELLATQLGQEPPRLTKQLDIYKDFDYKPHPIARESVEERAEDERTLE